MLLRVIADDLHRRGLGVVGTDIEIGDIPSGKGDKTMLFAAPSAPPDNELDNESQVIDFWVRFGNSKTGYDQLNAIKEAYHRAVQYQVGDYYIYLSEALGQIDDMDRDTENRKMWKISINFIYRVVTNVS